MKRAKVKLAVLPGDGIGAEVTLAALPVFKALDVPIQCILGDIGWDFWKQEGNTIPQKTWDLICSSDSILLGAITSKPQKEALRELNKKYQLSGLNYVSPIIQLRQQLDLFANVRPCFSIKEEDKLFNFCIIRENTEGLYAGFDYFPAPETLKPLLKHNAHWNNLPSEEMSCTLRLQSQEGLQRIYRFAFEYAATHGHHQVTLADKPNVLRQSSAFSRTLFEQIAKEYPQINANILNVDAVALWIIRRPEQFGVIVTENMFGDILSDVGAGVMGGLGFAPSANKGSNHCYFEPVHGSGLHMKANTANPCAMFLTIRMLLEHLGYSSEANILIQAIKTVLKEKQYLTYDLGGRATTQEMAQTIIEHCFSSTNNKALLSFSINKTPMPKPFTAEQQKQISTLSTSELSDALDSCGIEGALFDIKPLYPGLKLCGPAYTVKYSPYEQEPVEFQNAANYIDEVPAHSVLVLDNQGMKDKTVWGDILTQAALKKKIAGTVVHGAIRDVDSIKKMQYPLFSSAQYMRSGKNRVYKSNEQCPLIINKVTIYPGDIIFADDNGVLVIPQQLFPVILKKALQIQLTETKIKSAVQSGSSLHKARKRYGYNKPWEQ